MGNLTEQEQFWSGEFGTDYIARNQSEGLARSNIHFFEAALRKSKDIASVIEFGANVGMNMRALQQVRPGVDLRGVEINSDAAERLGAVIGNENVYHESLFDWDGEPADLSFTKGVLIHLNPDRLPEAYDRLYAASKRYVLVAEYYNPTPVAIPYRGHDDRLFKRDFAGEMLDRFEALRLIDYGFSYRNDPEFPQDDITWFLMKKG